MPWNASLNNMPFYVSFSTVFSAIFVLFLKKDHYFHYKWGTKIVKKWGIFSRKKPYYNRILRQKGNSIFYRKIRQKWGIFSKSVVKMATEGNIYYITKTKLKIMHAPANKSQK